MNAFLHHFAYDFKTGVRDRSRLLMFYLFPLVFFFLLGGLMSAINPTFLAGMVPAMSLFAFMCAALLNLPSVLVTAREAGVFRSYRINGVPAASIVSIPVLGTLVHMAIVSAIIAVAGARVYGAASPTALPGFLSGALLSYAAYAGLGVLIGVVASNGTAAILIAQVIYIPSIILGGLMVPVSMLPGALQKIALLLPATHAMRVMTALGGVGSAAAAPPVPWGSAAVLGAGTVLSLGLAALLFQWDSRASQPGGRKMALAILAAAPYVAAALLG
ncbi:MAG TPA: ABC transporter permease [Spirochaetia bacterium]|nr:ABC transporter permease [Spirochaetia bacterium]